MKVIMKIELQPFKTPDFVFAAARPGLRQDGIGDQHRSHSSDCGCHRKDGRAPH
jgi:hypothetical protein